MRICHLTSVHPYEDVRIFLKECKSLAKSGYEVHLVATNAPNITIDGVQIHGIEKDKSRLKRMTKTVQRVYRKALEIDANIYHFHDPELIPVGLLLKKRGKKVIYDVHEDVPKQILTKQWLPKYIRQFISAAFEKFENISAKKFDTIIAATPFIRDRFINIGCNAHDINNFPMLEELKIENIDWTEKDNSICYVGGISFERGIKEMLESINGMEHLTFNIAGKFMDLKERKIVESMPEWDLVKYLGFLNRAEIKEVYKNSKTGLVVLHPAINYLDSLPVKMFEYMAASIPVIASNFPLWRDIIENCQCGICVDPLNPNEIKKAVTFLQNNPDEAKKMGENGRSAIENKYNWEKESIKLLSIYRSL